MVKNIKIFSLVMLVYDREVICPFLFSLYLNDLEEFLKVNNIIGLKSISDEIETELNYYFKLFFILYADDTILMSESQSS